MSLKYLFILFSVISLSAQNSILKEIDYSDDKCGYDHETSMQLLQVLGTGWGYNYDSLLSDLNGWSASPFVKIDSVGSSVQGRILWMLTIEDTSQSSTPRRRVSVHARTHPNEVQAWWVTDEMINILLSDTPFAQALRQQCVFNIIPMYNPDGVELDFSRENANGVDIESGWNKTPLEVEVQSLKNHFTKLMASDAPIEVALNMHSSTRCLRYFVYHHQNGTSDLFTQLEQQFINGVESYWPEGIASWDYFVSWTSSTPTQYPESWFWLNFREAVMALTYEDMNCESAGEYARTADMLLNGVADYLGIEKVPVSIDPLKRQIVPDNFAVLDVYPNPVHKNIKSTIRLKLTDHMDGELSLFDILGRKVADIKAGNFRQGVNKISLSGLNLPGGIYFTSFKTKMGIVSAKILTMD